MNKKKTAVVVLSAAAVLAVFGAAVIAVGVRLSVGYIEKEKQNAQAVYKAVYYSAIDAYAEQGRIPEVLEPSDIHYLEPSVIEGIDEIAVDPNATENLKQDKEDDGRGIISYIVYHGIKYPEE